MYVLHKNPICVIYICHEIGNASNIAMRHKQDASNIDA